MKEKLKNIRLSKEKQIVIILFIIFAMMLILNFLTPIIADDYSYSFGANGERIKNIIDIIVRQIDHWLNWGGRNVAHFIANFLLMYPKTIFNILNSLMYTALVYLIYKHSQTTKEEKPLLLILIHLGLYFLTPVFGQNCIWLIGSCNYLWTIVIILIFLLMYRENYKKKDTIALSIGMLLLGIIAGWTNENTAFGLIVIEILSMLAYKGKDKIEKYKISGLIGTIIGFIMMICAPGNFIRNKEFADESSFVVKIIKRIFNVTISIMDLIPILIICVIILISIYIYKNKKIDKRAWIYLIASFLTIYAMVLSPTFPERAWFGIVVFMLISITSMIYNIEKIHKFFNIILIDIAIIGTFYYIGDYLLLAQDINELRATWNYRISTIEEMKESGQTDFEFSEYVTTNTKSPQYGLADISIEAHGWPNDAIEKYYEIGSIKRKIKE